MVVLGSILQIEAIIVKTRACLPFLLIKFLLLLVVHPVLAAMNNVTLTDKPGIKCPATNANLIEKHVCRMPLTKYDFFY